MKQKSYRPTSDQLRRWEPPRSQIKADPNVHSPHEADQPSPKTCISRFAQRKPTKMQKNSRQRILIPHGNVVRKHKWEKIYHRKSSESRFNECNECWRSAHSGALRRQKPPQLRQTPKLNPKYSPWPEYDAELHDLFHKISKSKSTMVI